MKSQQYRDEQKQREMSEIQAKKDHAREQVLIGTDVSTSVLRLIK